MVKSISGKFKGERGAEMLEMAIGLALLIGAFVIGGIIIKNAVYTRAYSSADAESTIVPCGTASGMAGDRCL